MKLTCRHSVHRRAVAGAVCSDRRRPVGSQFVDLFNGKDLTGWVNVNTAPDTWKVQDGLLICSGHPIGVMRSEKQYENFILHIEWMHMEPGGNSGVFVVEQRRARPGEPPARTASKSRCSSSTGRS